jgi:hypothetical protein
MKKASQLSQYDWAVGYLLNKYGENHYILSIAPSRWEWSESVEQFYDFMEDAIERMRFRTKKDHH